MAKCTQCNEDNIFKRKLCTRSGCPSKALPSNDSLEESAWSRNKRAQSKEFEPDEELPQDTPNEILEQYAAEREDQLQEIMSVADFTGETLEEKIRIAEEYLHKDDLGQTKETDLNPDEVEELWGEMDIMLSEAEIVPESRSIKLPNGKIIKLNAQQISALDLIMEWLIDRIQLFFTLSGVAGSGKTTLTKEAIKSFFNRGTGSVVVSAPTHKAKKVISNATGLEGETIHSLLGLAPNVELADFDINKPEFSPKKKPTIEYYKLVVVDEASMLNKDLWDMLKTQARRFNTKLLMQGDMCQLPPIKEDISRVFTDPDIAYKFELTKVERQAGDNPLMLIYDLVRSNLHKEHDQFHRQTNVVTSLRPDYEGPDDPREPQIENGIRFHNSLMEFGREVVTAFRSNEFTYNTDYAKVLCWTNAQVEFWNKSIRATLIADLQRQPHISQEVLLHSDVLIPNELLMGYGTYSDGLQSSGEYQVIAMQYDEKTIHWGEKKEFKSEIYGYRVSLLDVDQDTILSAFIVDPEEENIKRFGRVFDSYLFLAKTKKQWPAYFAFKGENLLMRDMRDNHGQLKYKKDLDYAYALTVHRSQGSTFDRVFVDMADINKNKNIVERNKLKYVALSRPRYLATVYTGGTDG